MDNLQQLAFPGIWKSWKHFFVLLHSKLQERWDWGYASVEFRIVCVEDKKSADLGIKHVDAEVAKCSLKKVILCTVFQQRAIHSVGSNLGNYKQKPHIRFYYLASVKLKCIALEFHISQKNMKLWLCNKILTIKEKKDFRWVCFLDMMPFQLAELLNTNVISLVNGLKTSCSLAMSHLFINFNCLLVLFQLCSVGCYFQKALVCWAKREGRKPASLLAQKMNRSQIIYLFLITMNHLVDSSPL